MMLHNENDDSFSPNIKTKSLTADTFLLSQFDDEMRM